MALFEVEGWGLDNKEIKLGGENKKKVKNGKKKEGKVVKKSVSKKNTKPRERQDVEEAVEKVVEKEAAVERTTPSNLTPLQQKMFLKLSGSRFRYINEKLYTITSEEALNLIKEQPSLFDVYHEGFKSQVQSWPQNPVDVFVSQIKQRSVKQINAPGGLPGLNRQIVIADMGCGELQLSADVNKYVKSMNKKVRKDIVVHSFDLLKLNERVTVADIRNVPLPDGSCSVVIFCLLLMGTNFLDFIQELYRLLIPRGELWISEIKSRFSDGKGEEFVDTLKMLGFFHKSTDNENKMFTRFEFFKPAKDVLDERMRKLKRHSRLDEFETLKEEFESKRLAKSESQWLLKPCIYKRR